MQQSEKGSIENILAEMRGLADDVLARSTMDDHVGKALALRALIRQAMALADAVNDGDGRRWLRDMAAGDQDRIETAAETEPRSANNGP